MEERAQTSTALAEPIGKSFRHARSAQIVGSYVGELAAEAAQAVRRSGLKPGLERTFGCAAELLGQVVAQEPASGSELARNGLVTLYVAAPGNHESADLPERERVNESSTLAHELAAPASERDASGPRPRKPGRSARRAQAVDAPPAPRPRRSKERGELVKEPAPDASVPLGQRDEAPASSEPAPDLEQLVADELVIHAEDLFAGSAARWRRGYPRRARGALRARAGAHPWLLRLAGGLLALWLILAVASALGGHGMRQRKPSVPQPSRESAHGPAPAALRPSPSRRAPSARHVHGAHTAPAHIRGRRRPSARAGHSPSGSPDPSKHTPARVDDPSPAADGSAPASTTPAEGRDPRNGGLFSP